MDGSELHYLTYDPDAIWTRMMENYVAAGGDILYPGDEKSMLLRAVQADIVQVFAGVDNALRMMTLRYAVGDYLDILGEQRSCPRIDAQAARAAVTITTHATGKTDVLKAGTAMTADGEIFYLLADDLTLSGYAQTVTAEVVADRAGSVGNGLTAGTEMGLAIANSGVSRIVVAESASGGNEREGDDAYRERIRTYGMASVTTGPRQQYEAAAKAVSPQIIDAKALREDAGKVGICLVLEDGGGAEDMIRRVEERLSADDTRPLTDHVHVYEAKVLPYTLEARCDAGEASMAALQAAADAYQAWQESEAGRAFNPDRLMAALYQAGATRVQWDEKSNFNGGAAVYTEIQADERCKGAVSLTGLS